MRTIQKTSVCVAGGAGFLGSHLVNHLIEDRECFVLVVDNLVAGRREFVHPKAKFVHHNITQSESYLCDLFKHWDIKYVANYIAYPYVPTSFARPIHVSDVNYMGAMKVINAAQEAGVEGILQVSSAEIYGDGNPNGRLAKGPGLDFERVFDGKISENAPAIPHSSYGVAKAAVDNAVQVRWREARTPCIALRQFNCIGERETHPYIVPEIIGQLAEKWHEGNVTSVKLGNNSFRDFLYAGDAVRMAVELLEKGEFGEVYNLGSETGIKMYDLAKLIGKVMGFADVTVEPDPARMRPWEIWMLQSSNTKIYSVIESRPTVSLEEALRRAVAWFEQNGRKWPWQ